jgi:uncharacterized heparinase superfamily protein
VDLAIGQGLLEGRLVLAGALMTLPANADPFDRPCPTRAFAVELHRFSWLASLLEAGPEGLGAALRLALDWTRSFPRPAPFVWDPEILAPRVQNLALALPRLLAAASDLEGQTLMRALQRQTRHLLNVRRDLQRPCAAAAAATAAAVVLAGPAGAALMRRAMPRLVERLEAEVLPDGGVRTRRPEEALEVLLALLSLDDALLARGEEAPGTVSRAIDRLTQGVRFFSLGDGRLAAFNGGEAADAGAVAAALAHDDGEGRVQPLLPYGGYHRLRGRALLVMVDAGAPPKGPLSAAACAQPLALEVTAGADRLICNTGWSPDAQGPQGLRLTAGGSTAALGEGSAGRLLGGLAARAFGPRIVGGPTRVDAVRNENDNGVWLELSHDGWVEEFGLIHERRLYLDGEEDELRGEDRFAPAPGPQRPRRRIVGYAVRFHLPPTVKVSLARDRRSVLLRGPSNRGWWFRNDAPDVYLEVSTMFEGRQAHRGSQVVLKGPLSREGARVRWKLAPVEAEGPKSLRSGARPKSVLAASASLIGLSPPPP